MIVDLHGYWIAAAALLGLLIGSFLNVCIYRLPRDLSIVAPRSFCPECGHSIAWYDNLPLLSFALLRGQCRQCTQPIGWRYPVVEILTAILFADIAFRYGWSPSAGKWFLFEALMVVLFFTDLEERLLPDELTLGGAAIGFLLAFWVPVHGSLIDMLFSAASVKTRSVANAVGAAFIFSLPLWLLAKLYEKVRHQTEALGLGDIKLLAALGMFLGFDAELAALLMSSLAGAVFGVGYVVITRANWRTASLPFGSFLCVGGALMPLLSRL